MLKSNQVNAHHFDFDRDGDGEVTLDEIMRDNPAVVGTSGRGSALP